MRQVHYRDGMRSKELFWFVLRQKIPWFLILVIHQNHFGSLKKIPVSISHLQESKSTSLVMWPRCLHTSTYPSVCRCTCIHVCSSADFSGKPGNYRRFIQVIQQMLTSCTHYGIVLGNYRQRQKAESKRPKLHEGKEIIYRIMFLKNGGLRECGTHMQGCPY